MREATGPAWDPLPESAHLLQPVIERAQADASRPVAAYRDGDHFVDVAAGEMYERVRAVAKGLIASGVDPGERVALMSRTRLEWTVLDYAILAVGAVTVPLYETASAEQVQWIVGDSGAVLTIVETPAMHALYDEIHDHVHDCGEVLVIDDGAIAELTRRGAAVSDEALDASIAAIRTNDLATIIYTSGTTGRPKGCMLTHGNLRTNALQNIDAIRGMLTDDEVGLLFLPLAHSLAKIVSLVCAEWGVKVAYATDMAQHLVEELPMVQPTMIVAVPRVFERVWNAAQHKAHDEGKAPGAIFNHAAEIAIDWSRVHGTDEHHPLLSVEHRLFDHLVYSKVRAGFGGRLRFAFSGGGPLGERLTHFFNGIGVRIFEGYGLTETSPTLTLNRADGWTPGTVGRPLAGTAIRIAEDGEILAKGPQVFQGYWHNDVATADTFDRNGWFKTGDIGEFTEGGFVRITGRKKELIVTAAGKNVAPTPLEDRLRAHELVSQAVVIGDARPFVAALLTLDDEAFKRWASAHDRDGATVEAMAHDPDLRDEVQALIDDANQSVSRAESIRAFAVLPRDLTIEAGELTPTLKVRRSVVEKSYADVIDAIYHR